MSAPTLLQRKAEVFTAEVERVMKLIQWSMASGGLWEARIGKRCIGDASRVRGGRWIMCRRHGRGLYYVNCPTLAWAKVELAWRYVAAGGRR